MRESEKRHWYKHRPIVEAIRLHDGSLPQSTAQTSDPEAVDRRLDCRRVSQCLSLAVDRHWEALSCGMCPIDDPLSREEQRQDMRGLAEMLDAARIWETTNPRREREANRLYRRPGR